ncbi:CAAX protease self-immunity-domain-containing protein [Endogone sp. FLAS-F59071]|nr:CAAX protease self-immunity-domain-containing protein [Endogone sp. FLAS-F59071]|eukprot:RUS17468.1 CAAX protease self-immunity-domain-containing protein [Endogone sp. FLAS-F59071]
MLDWFERNLPFQRNFDFQVDVIKEITSLVGLRNFIVAPITEEFIFRACIVSTLYLGGFSTLAIILISPLYFGIAHVHHGWEIYHTYGETSYALKQALFTMGFQFLYTSLFGWYATYSFMRTGLLLPVILQHAFCNVMGFPDMSNVKRHPGWARIVIWTSLVLGAVGFTWTWFSLLNPKLFGGSLYW